MERAGPTAWLRDDDGRRVTYPMALSSSESLLSQLKERHRYPEVAALGDRIGAWRLYHHFRTDAEAPVRQPQVGVHSPVLDADGSNLAAAWQTIREIGDGPALDSAVAEAFPGSRVIVHADEALRVSLRVSMPGVLRPLDVGELSDGTLRYLSLLAALLSPRPPAMLALNEPETSLHPALLGPLGRLIARAASVTQLFVTTHSRALAEAVARDTRARLVEIALDQGATRIVRGAGDDPSDGDADSDD
jgi:predicted ATPase